MRPQQPMPATTTTFSGFSLSERTASSIARSTMPLEQPGHQIVFRVVRWRVSSSVECSLTAGSWWSSGCWSSRTSSTRAVIAELLCDQLLDLLRRDQTAVHAAVIDHLGASRYGRRRWWVSWRCIPVSYTHLTLPTIYSV